MGLSHENHKWREHARIRNNETIVEYGYYSHLYKKPTIKGKMDENSSKVKLVNKLLCIVETIARLVRCTVLMCAELCISFLRNNNTKHLLLGFNILCPVIFIQGVAKVWKLFNE